MKGRLRWWVFSLGVLVVLLKATGDARLSWSVLQYVAFSIVGLSVILSLLAGYFEWKQRKSGGSDGR